MVHFHVRQFVANRQCQIGQLVFGLVLEIVQELAIDLEFEWVAVLVSEWVVAVWGCCGVGLLRCGGVAVWGSCGVGWLRCGGVAVWGSCSVGELQFGQVAVWRSCGVAEWH